MEPDAVEIRVAACLVEKQRTTPDAYPLTLNSLRLACNQSTNREPVVDYDESTIRGAIDRLVHRRWVTLASWSNRRAMKYRHTLDQALSLDDAELSLMCVLMLRGPQTPGELRARTERLHRFGDADELDEALARLAGRELVARIGRRPGQREDRYVQLLGGEEEEAAAARTAPAAMAAPNPAPPPPAEDRGEPAATPSPPQGDPGLAGRVERLERELDDLRESLSTLRAELGA